MLPKPRSTRRRNAAPAPAAADLPATQALPEPEQMETVEEAAAAAPAEKAAPRARTGGAAMPKSQQELDAEAAAIATLKDNGPKRSRLVM